MPTCTPLTALVVPALGLLAIGGFGAVAGASLEGLRVLLLSLPDPSDVVVAPLPAAETAAGGEGSLLLGLLSLLTLGLALELARLLVS